jgi:hypothetical protein
MDYREKRDREAKESGERICASLIGKTIKSANVEVGLIADLRTLYIECTDGSTIRFSTSGAGGCPECDPDGMNEANLEVDVTKKKGDFNELGL